MNKVVMNRLAVLLAAVLLAGPAVHAGDPDVGLDTEAELDAVDDAGTGSDETPRALAGTRVLTPDGRHVLLRDDYTWEYIEVDAGVPEESAVLTVANVQTLSNACKVGLKLKNNLGYRIRSLVPSFSAYTRKDVLYETVSKAFSSIKPTLEQYRQIQFIGLRCADIDHILVHGAEHCHMGPLDKFTKERGRCLSHIYVQASDMIEISK